MKRFLLILAFVAAIATAVNVGQAAIVVYNYTFTGADLINNVFDSTARYSTDGSLKVYEGMRQIGPAEGTAVGATFLGTSYPTAFTNAWDTAVTKNRVLSTFWLSGNNSYSGQWGEDYKPLEWVSGTGPTGWTFLIDEDEDPVWTTTTAGLSLTSTELASEVFTVTIKFDTEDMWYNNPNNYLYGCNTAPNSLDGLTMYFGSYFSEDGTDVNRYVGNMFAEGTQVPEPATILVWGLLGLIAAGYGVWRRKR
ncbi:MAG: PEP-CTERM sorting domain-containing protein [Pirellulaceae bacterium]|nr:PEP-CTERM sorting domain-containing protein [Pirellulaceae bacterium]